MRQPLAIDDIDGVRDAADAGARTIFQTAANIPNTSMDKPATAATTALFGKCSCQTMIDPQPPPITTVNTRQV